MKTQGEGKDAWNLPLASSLLDSAPSRLAGMTVDKPLGLSPNRLDGSHRSDFGGVNILNPFHRDLRSCSEPLARLLMASAPLPRTPPVYSCIAVRSRNVAEVAAHRDNAPCRAGLRSARAACSALVCCSAKKSAYGPLKSSTRPPWKCQMREATSSITS
jgi:hypothetical protein